ncbi:RNA-directed DNA polymerase, eukaryota, Reverse transcriptase zinc-binding domain protein [Artemisia annua]|uniref:RNA-directed DNA polymerase, eukaryota, Reverse transcriptase zinc-binding domain protein n=1 Tax=Artemisia annua TaxID=35608 RepID=A0A2U1PHS9_ARTAN|nr:RNA-directed DNA polymerase, eukaryota, Reverse transcriptase zinc-binding domain protein [Artemisia annua]
MTIRSKSAPWFQIAKLNEDLSVQGIDLHSLFKRKIGNGENTRFWIDKWVGNSPLCSAFPRLFRIESQKNCRVSERALFFIPHAHCSDHLSLESNARLPSVSTYISQIGPSGPPGMNFRWAWFRLPRSGADLEELLELESLISNIHLSSECDTWECLLDSSRIFTVKSMRSVITNSNVPLDQTPPRWNNLIPIKVNVSSWRIENRRLPTRVNLDLKGRIILFQSKSMLTWIRFVAQFVTKT